MKIKREFEERESRFASAIKYAEAIENDVFCSDDLLPYGSYNDKVKFFKELAAHLGVAAVFCEEEIMPGGRMEG